MDTRAAGSPLGWESPDGQLFLTPDELRAYQALLTGQRVKAPQGFWRGDGGLLRGLACVRYAFEVVRGATTRAAVLALANEATLTELHLISILLVHRLRVYDAVTRAFPAYAFQPWELGRTPRGYWRQGGDPVIREALTWFLAQEGLTVAELLDLHRRHAISLAARLDHYGLSELYAHRSIWELLRLLAPELPADPPLSQRARWRREATLRCPWCARRLRSLAPHVLQAHGRTGAELRAVLGPAASLEVPAVTRRRSRANQQPRRVHLRSGQVVLPDQPGWTAAGLSLPGAWWPARSPRVQFTLDAHGLLLRPLQGRAALSRRLQRRGSRWLWAPPPSLRALLRQAPVELHPQGVRVVLLDDVVRAHVQAWLGPRPGSGPPSRSEHGPV